MFGIGMTEIMILMVIALVVIGPSKLPDLAKALGKGLAEFKKASQEITNSFNLDEEIKSIKDETMDTINDFKDSIENYDEDTPPDMTGEEADEEESPEAAEEETAPAADTEETPLADADEDQDTETEKKETPPNE